MKNLIKTYKPKISRKRLLYEQAKRDLQIKEEQLKKELAEYRLKLLGMTNEFINKKENNEYFSQKVCKFATIENVCKHEVVIHNNNFNLLNELNLGDFFIKTIMSYGFSSIPIIYDGIFLPEDNSNIKDRIRNFFILLEAKVQEKENLLISMNTKWRKMKEDKSKYFCFIVTR